MGREVRRVPPNWEHPNAEGGGLQPMFDRNFEDAAAEWKAGLAAWEAGGRLKELRPDGTVYEYWEWSGNPPMREYHRPWRDDEATWYQVWETVTEGTPITPPFATKEELVGHLTKYGTLWDDDGWGAKAARAFVEEEWAPSFMVADGVLVEGKDVPAFFGEHGGQQ